MSKQRGLQITHIYVPNSLFLLPACMASLCISSSVGILRPEGVMPCLLGKELSLHRIGHLLNQMPVPKSQKRGFRSDSTKCCQEQMDKVVIFCVKTFSSPCPHLLSTIWHCSVIQGWPSTLCSRHCLSWLSYNLDCQLFAKSYFSQRGAYISVG